MWNNPEIRKASITQFSVLNIVLIPIVGMLILLLPMQMADSLEDKIQGLHMVALSIFAIAAFLVGPILSANAVFKEIKNRTWSNQRLTLLTPMEMLLGKWFGSTQYLWLISICAWIVFMVVALFRGFTFFSWTMGLALLIASVAVQFLAGVSGLIVSRRYQSNRNPAIGLAVIGGCFAFFPLMILLVSSLDDLRIPEMDWWLWTFNAHWVTLGLSIVALGFSFLWYLYEMKIEMNYPNHFELNRKPFKLFNMSILILLFVTMGFGQEVEEVLSIGAAIIILLLYLFSLGFDRNSLLKLKGSNVFTAHYFLRSAYVWLLLLFLLTLVLQSQLEDVIIPHAISVIGMMLRDTFVYFFLLLSRKVKKPEALWLVYMVCFHVFMIPLGTAIFGKSFTLLFMPYDENLSLMQSMVTLGIGLAMVIWVHIKRKGIQS